MLLRLINLKGKYFIKYFRTNFFIYKSAHKSSPTKMDLYEAEEFEKLLNQELNNQIRNVFLKFYIDIFGYFYLNLYMFTITFLLLHFL